MSIRQQWELASLVEVLLFVGTPAIVFWILSRTQLRSFRPAIVLTTLSSWALLYWFHRYKALPISRLYATERADSEYDGVGGNAAILLFGWFWPLVASLLGA